MVLSFVVAKRAADLKEDGTNGRGGAGGNKCESRRRRAGGRD